jgi:hypothetical protein
VDPTGLLDAVLAVAIYPGAAFVALAAVLHRGVAGRPAGLGTPGPVPAATLLPVLAAVVASAMLPMVGSPALRLPPPAGAAGNVVAVVVLLAVAVDLGAASRVVAALAAAAAVPVLALAAAGSTVSVVAICTAGGTAGVAARATAAATLLLAASSTAGGRAASVVDAALALAAAALVIPAALAAAPPITCGLAALGVVALSGLLARLRDRMAVGVITAAGITGSVGATVLALLSGRV